MEGNNAQNMPVNCANGCGLYGNPINNNMCSKCFKETSQASTDLPVDPAAAVAAVSAVSSSSSSSSTSSQPLLDTPMTDAVTPLPASASSSLSTSASSLTPLSGVSPMTMAVPTPTPVPQPSLSRPLSKPMGGIPSVASPVPMMPTMPSVRMPSLAQMTKVEATERQEPGVRPVQTNKGRCFMCRAKIPLAKQTINKCRCEYIFCDAHKTTSKHDCDFDYAKMDRDLLAKNNPKLNDKPRGGRSFTRLD